MKKSTLRLLYPIDRFMTHAPHTVEPDENLAQARRLMREIGARHLPVVESGKLVGIVSERDLIMLEALTDASPDRVPVRSAMQRDVFEVDRHTPLDEVAETMASNKYGSAVVCTGTAVVGIFTTVDALSALVALLREMATR